MLGAGESVRKSREAVEHKYVCILDLVDSKEGVVHGSNHKVWRLGSLTSIML